MKSSTATDYVEGMIPPRSPFGLLQEDIWPDHWLILVSCMLLNCTTRKQVEKVLPEFIRRWPTPQSLLAGERFDTLVELGNLIAPLGFARRRTVNIYNMTTRYLGAPWKHAQELPGIGEYAARAWEIFCRGELGTEPPKDHALAQYYLWAKQRADDTNS
jgi:methyl-CpG-binding domain protein 4